MYFLGFVVAVIFVLLVLYSPGKLSTRGGGDVIFDGERKIVKYSGLDPSSYTEFVNDLQLMKSTYDPQYLYSAIDKLEDLSLNTQNSDLHIVEDIKLIIVSIGKDGETYIMKNALDEGHPFIPIYLNTL